MAISNTGVQVLQKGKGGKNRITAIMSPEATGDYIKTLDRSKAVILAPSHHAAATAIKRSMAWGFDRASGPSGRVLNNTAATIAAKPQRGRLIESGRLQLAMRSVDADVSYAGSQVVGAVTVYMPTAGTKGKGGLITPRGLNRRNKSFPYGLAQLYGAGGGMRKFGHGDNFNLPPRDFISEGLRVGSRRAATIVAAAYKQYYDAFISPEFFQRRVLPFSYENQLTLKTADIISIAMPPTAKYSLIGAGRDFTSVIHLTFTTFTMNAWFGSLIAGHAGLTKRPYIRSARSATWGKV